MIEILIILILLLFILGIGIVVVQRKKHKINPSPSPSPSPLPPPTENYFYKGEDSSNFKADWNMSKEERKLQCKYTLGGLNQKYTIKTPPNEQPIDFKKLFPLNYDG